MSIVTLIRGAAVAAVVALLATLAGCASIVNGTKQEVMITSTPPGAHVYVDSVRVGSTPLLTTLQRGEAHHIEVRKDGQRNNGLVVRRELSKWFWGNLPVWPGFIYDLANGAAYEFREEEIDVRFDERGTALYKDITPRAPAARNILYAEFAGNAYLASINYERQIVDNLGLRAGLSAGWIGKFSDKSIRPIHVVTPLMATYLIGGEESHLELGAGVTLEWSRKPIYTGVVGYRYQPREGGFVFRVGYTPLILDVDDMASTLHWGGMSIGMAF